MSLLMPNVNDWLHRNEATRVVEDMSACSLAKDCLGFALVKMTSPNRRLTGPAFLQRSWLAKGVGDERFDADHFTRASSHYVVFLDYCLSIAYGDFNADDYAALSIVDTSTNSGSERRSDAWMDLIENPTTRPGEETYAVVIDGLLDMISDESFSRLDEFFAKVNVSKVSTDFLVALPSITYENRSQLINWDGLYRRIVRELESRGVDVRLELAGLDDIAGAS